MDITDTNNLIWEDSMSDLRDIATLCKEIDYLTAQMDTLRRERDEARREVCECKVHQQHDPVQLAQDRGWDCFKENTNG